jgi:hypothetical protein
MGRGAAIRNSFNAGEWSPLLAGRTDLQKYDSACAKMLNFLPQMEGPATRRPGTISVHQTLATDNTHARSVLVPFVVDRTTAYVLEFGEGGVYVYHDHKLIPQHAPTYDAILNSPTIFPNPPRDANEDSTLSYTQSGDILYVCDSRGNRPCYVIKHFAINNWTITPYILMIPPFQDYGDEKEELTYYGESLTPTPTSHYVFYPKIKASTGYWPTHTIGMRIKLDLRSDIGTDADIEDGYRSWTGEQAYEIINQGPFWPGDTTRNNSATNSLTVLEYNGALYNLESNTLQAGGLRFTIPNPPVHVFGVRAIKVIDEHNNSQNAYARYIGTLQPSFLITSDPFASDGGDCVRVCHEIDIASDGLAAPKSNALLMFGCKTKKWAWASIPGSEPIEPGAAYPDHVGFFRDRFMMSSGNTVYMSQSGDYANFMETDRNGNIVADSALTIGVLDGFGEKISWICSGAALFVGRLSGVWAIMEGNNTASAFGPLNFQLQKISSDGCALTQPAITADGIAFLSRNRTRINLIAADGKITEISKYFRHIGDESEYSDLTWQNSERLLWAVRKNGTAVAILLNLAEDIASASVQKIGKKYGDGDYLIVDLASIPSVDGATDEVYIFENADRDIVTSLWTVKILAYLGPVFAESSDIRVSSFVDNATIYDYRSPVVVHNRFWSPYQFAITGSPQGVGDLVTITFSDEDGTCPAIFQVSDAGDYFRIWGADAYGEKTTDFLVVEIVAFLTTKSISARIDHFSGASIMPSRKGWFWEFLRSSFAYGFAKDPQILADGGSREDESFASFTATLEKPAATVVVGQKYDSILKPTRIEAQADDGIAQGKTKRIHHVTVRAHLGYGGRIGESESRTDAIETRTTSDAQNNPVPPWTGDRSIPFPAGNGSDGYICITQDQPMPLTIVALIVDLETRTR